MKFTKLFMTAAAAVSAAAMLTAAASAYTLDKDLGTMWSANVTVPGEEFADLTETTYITVTYTGDESLADVEGQSYWCIKPMVNDSGWPLISGIAELPATEDGSAYDVDPAASSVTFTVPADFVEAVKTAGIAFIGHGITLNELTVSNEAPVVDEAPVADETPAQDTTAADTTDTKGSPDTGVEGVGLAVAAAAVAGAAVVFSRKRK